MGAAGELIDLGDERLVAQFRRQGASLLRWVCKHVDPVWACICVAFNDQNADIMIDTPAGRLNVTETSRLSPGASVPAAPPSVMLNCGSLTRPPSFAVDMPIRVISKGSPPGFVMFTGRVVCSPAAVALKSSTRGAISIATTSSADALNGMAIRPPSTLSAFVSTMSVASEPAASSGW